MKPIAFLVAVCGLLVCAYAEDVRERLADHVVIVSIDGARPDVMLRAKMPHLRSLLDRGSFSFWARTTDSAVTLPSHASMLTGVKPEKHGINFNDDRDEKLDTFPSVPTIFDLAKARGWTTAMVATKSKFTLLARPGSVDWMHVPQRGQYSSDVDTAQAASRFIREHRPAVSVVHLGQTDGAGHRHGWGTPQQIQALEQADQALGIVLQAIDDAGITNRTLLIVSSDHGGSGKSHGRNDVRSRYIPWIAVGPGIQPGQDLTIFRDLQINTEDTFVTACYFLGLDLPEDLDGQPVVEILEKRELLEQVGQRP